MREIKFRVSIDGEVSIMTLHEMLEGGPELIDWCYELEGQFTGLKDKNGKEIYEGDIVVGSNCGKCIIEFRNGAFRPSFSSHMGYIKQKEVVGNIYENPELLKGEEE